MVGQPSFDKSEYLTNAYITAAKGIRLQTLLRLGLSEKYHQALQRYPEVSCHFDCLGLRHLDRNCSNSNQIAHYRSSKPFQTEFGFAKWLIEEREDRPELYSFWSKLFPVCYNRSVEQSASIF